MKYAIDDNNSMDNNKKNKIGFKFQVSGFRKLLLCLLIVFSWFSTAKGAILYLDPASGEYQPGQTFIVKIRIDTENECVNAISANLSYDKNILKVIDFSQGESIISLWLEKPEIDEEEGRISFSGGIPGGYCGRIPGDPGESDTLGKIIFKVPGFLVMETEKNIIEIKFLEDCQVLLNDSLGTKAKLTLKGAKFEISEEAIPVVDQWEKEISEDEIPPEPFEILVLRDPKIFEGRYFIIFQTVDKQTGIDHYEILEADQGGYKPGTRQKAEWKLTESPYLLEDQELQSIIKVKAIDKARNERISEFLPEEKPKPFPWWMIIVTLIIGGLIWWLIRKISARNRRETIRKTDAKNP